MSFKDFDIKISYRNVGEEQLMDAINPLLASSKYYKRSVGFFSSSCFSFIGEGLINLARNGGHIYLATSPKLSEEDINAISTGYINRSTLVRDKFIEEFRSSLNEITDENAKLLEMLISAGILDIKVVLKNGGMYHDKLTLLEDYDGNKVVFVGSPNESGPGYNGEDGNYEKVRIFKSWTDPDGHVKDETEEFDSIWNGSNDALETFSFMDAVKESVVERIEHKGNSNGKPYKIREYQDEAKNNWINNGYKGFFVMATGTGKTVTTLNAIYELIKEKQLLVVIAVPYKHLVRQWAEDVGLFFPDIDTHQVHSEITDAETTLYSAYKTAKLNGKSIIVITTIRSFFLERFQKLYEERIDFKRLLIVDEAHNFVNYLSDELSDKYIYKIGLSATPVFGTSLEKTEQLLSWFGGQVYDLPIEKAIGKYLVEYYYFPIYVDATPNDEKEFNKFTRMMVSAFDSKTKKIINEEKFLQGYRGRLRSISMASEKMDNIGSIFGQIKEQDHTIIYCSDGKIFTSVNSKSDVEETRHLEYILSLINNSIIQTNKKASKFTATEDVDTRMKLINNFNKQYIDYLVAIRCLDEGINIPSIKAALILSSNDNYREFVQRRGRILRFDPNNPDKKTASIYDVIVKPSYENKNFIKIELRRFYEYASLAINKDKLLPELDSLLAEYDLTREDIKFDNEYIYGGEMDE